MRANGVAATQPRSWRSSIFGFCEHPQHDRFQHRQMDGRNLPELSVVEALIFMPQYIADTDDRAPWSITVFGQNIFWQGLGRLRDNLYGAFNRAPVHVTVAVFRKRQPSDRRRHALDFIAHAEQACARIL